MVKNFEISYEEIEDILYIGINEKVKFSIDLALPSGDVVVDIGFDGLVKGIEIFNASKFFSITDKDLKRINDGDFKVIYNPSYAALSINLFKESQIIKSNIVIPYNKKTILA